MALAWFHPSPTPVAVTFLAEPVRVEVHQLKKGSRGRRSALKSYRCMGRTCGLCAEHHPHRTRYVAMVSLVNERVPRYWEMGAEAMRELCLKAGGGPIAGVTCQVLSLPRGKSSNGYAAFKEVGRHLGVPGREIEALVFQQYPRAQQVPAAALPLGAAA